ncbi:MAG TPA: STAS domain-containing protein [Solirubrobacteraceae bacterium]
MADAAYEQLTVEHFDEGDRRVVVLAGELDVATADIAEQALEHGLDVLDLSRLEFMDSAGVRILLGICRERQDPLVVRGVTRPVRRILELTGVCNMLVFEDSATDRLGSSRRR